jgi:rhodanese-related sulfurtransferase
LPITTIPAKDATKLISQGALLIDIRSPDEYARERIPNARLHPLSQITANSIGDGAPAVIFHCRSGFRTTANAATLVAAAKCNAYVLEGGLEAWRDTGFPTIKEPKRPIEIMRQVQILIGGMVLVGVLLGMLAAPAFFIIPLFMGGGLIFAGVTGSCAMAKALTFLPMNRQATKAGGGT